MDFLNMGEVLSAKMNASANGNETGFVHGHYDVVCTDAEGNVLWADGFDNLVTNLGLTTLVASGVTGTTAYMGLISASGYSAVALTDTIGSHAGWQEAGQGAYGPTYGTTRPTASPWGTITNGVVSTTTTTYSMTGSGTVEGAFIVNGTGASNVVGNTTGGVLFSAGTLSTPQPVVNANTITMTYTLTLTG